MTPEEMKEAWQSARIKERDNYTDISLLLRRQTSLERLRRRYRRFVGIACAMLAFDILFLKMEIIPDNWRIPLVILLDFYFIVCGCMDFWLYTQTGKIDVFTMSVREIASIAIMSRKRHHQFMFALIPFAICILIVFAFILADDRSAQIGAIAGGLIGGGAGFVVYRRMMRDYKIIAGGHADLDDE